MALLMVSVLSTVIAATTSVMAWRLARREARRSDARVAALTAAIYGHESAISIDLSADVASFPSEHPETLDGGAASRVLGRRSLAMASGALVVVCLLTFTAATRRAAHRPLGAGPTVSDQGAMVNVPRASARASTDTALELVALSHERAKDTLVVRGTLRNPADGAPCEMPAVVVLIFDQRGIFLGSSESAASGESLQPGSQLAFSVSIPASVMPARYRVSFRRDGHVVPHVDKRGADPGAGQVSAVSSSVRQPWTLGPVQS